VAHDTKAYVLTVPVELDTLIRQAMRDEGIDTTRDNVHRWMIGALVFTAAACSTPGYQAICDAYGMTREKRLRPDDTPTLPHPPGKPPPSD